MKTKFTFIQRAALLLLLSTINHQLSAQGQGTAFTYQGRLNSSGTPASGNYDLTFTLFDSPSGGASVGSFVQLTAVQVSNGLFTVTINTNNEFGATAFNGAARWLEIGVRTNCSCLLNFTTLTPRQQLTPTPYAIFAENVGVGGLAAGTYGNAVTLNNAANNFSGTFSGNGAGVTNVNAATLGGLSSSNFWKLAGNAGANPTNGNFLGTTDNLPLEFRVNNVRVLRLEPNATSPNMIGGFRSNSVDSVLAGVTIGGGGSSGLPNRVAVGNYATVSGGQGNTSSNVWATVGGGYHHNASGDSSTISGGFQNVASGTDATVGGGENNKSTGSEATIGGGIANISSGIAAAVPGGSGNTAAGDYSFAAGYQSAANGDYAVAMGKGSSANGTGSTALGSFSAAGNTNSTALGNSIAVGNYSISAGQSVTTGDFSTAMGKSSALAIGSTAGGASKASGNYSVALGTATASGNSATAIGPASIATGDFSVAMGYLCTTTNSGSFALGTAAHAKNFGSFVWSDAFDGGFVSFDSTADNQFLIQARGGVGIGLNNPAAALHVASASSAPELQITQNNSSDYTRLRMNVGSFQPWEIDVSPGASPRLEFWAGFRRMFIDFAGNVTATSFNPTSDRNAKENFEPVNAREVLDKVAALPLTEWNFKEDSATKHIGPMAQDFYAAFGVGPDNKHIATVDADGVALAAIQGLNQKLLEQEAALKNKDSEIQELRQAVAELQKTVRKITKQTQEQP